jgi:hypothetical protein
MFSNEKRKAREIFLIKKIESIHRKRVRDKF